jgi:hypothetical protein
MAKNTGQGHRIGAVRERVQYLNPRTGLHVKVDTTTGQFMDNKTTGGPFKGVRQGDSES